MRFRLRTLLILLAVGPPVLAVAWWLVNFVHDPIPSQSGGPLPPMGLLAVGAMLYPAAWAAVIALWWWSHRDQQSS